MKKIIITLVPYILAFIILNVAIYYTSGFYKQKRKYIQTFDASVHKQPETIFLGDSHIEMIKNIDLSQQIGNHAFGGDGINEMYIKLLFNIQYNKNLKNVFIATEPQIFNNTLSSNSTFLNKYILKLNASNPYNKSKLALLAEQIPLCNDSYLRFVLNKIYSDLRQNRNKKQKNWHELSITERNIIAVNTGISDHSSLMTNYEYLETYKKIVALCNNNDIRVFGINFPVSKHYIEQAKAEDIEKINSFLEELDLYTNLDYSSSINDPNCFLDVDHLNKNGILKLSEYIYRDTQIKLTD